MLFPEWEEREVIMRMLAVVLALFAVALFGVACGDDETPKKPDPGNGMDVGQATPDMPGEPDLPDKPEIEAATAEALVKASCASCHGMDKLSGATKTADEWEEQVTVCLGMADDPPSEKDAATIVVFIKGKYATE